MAEAVLVVLVIGTVALVPGSHQQLPHKITACCYDSKNTNIAWLTIQVRTLKWPE